jgi:hypothetical protein
MEGVQNTRGEKQGEALTRHPSPLKTPKQKKPNQSNQKKK